MLRSKKREPDGFNERIQILSKYLGHENTEGLWDKGKMLRCNPDDIVDAVCLAVVAEQKAQGNFATVPEKPGRDARGLLMQMVVPSGG